MGPHLIGYCGVWGLGESRRGAYFAHTSDRTSGELILEGERLLGRHVEVVEELSQVVKSLSEQLLVM